MSLKSLLGSGIVAVAAVLIVACSAAPAPSAPAATAAPSPSAPAATAAMDMSGMDHSAMSDTSKTPYDARFIDSMIVHHEGAIAMAQQALTASKRPEIRQLAETIVGAQQKEIMQLRAWRSAWYPDRAQSGGMQMDMGPMRVADESTPFDQRFIEAMIPHHAGAVTMARDALQKAEHQEIKDLARAIITAQEAEIGQMRQWLQEWYGITQ